MKNPFVETVQDCIPHELDAVQEEFQNIINDYNAKVLLSTITLPNSWCSMLCTYPLVAQIAIKAILPFPSTYLCETGYSSLVAIKTKNRNRLDVIPDLRYCLSETEPRISLLVEKSSSNLYIRYCDNYFPTLSNFFTFLINTTNQEIKHF